MMDAKQLSDKCLSLTHEVITALDHLPATSADSMDLNPTEAGDRSFTFNVTKDTGRHQRIVYKVTIEASFQDDDADEEV